MYDFYFGKKEKIEKNPLKWLLAIKRMLPRFVNSIPDSEFSALYHVLRESKLVKTPVLIETGCGASTIVLLEYVLRYGGQLYTWDISGMKLSYMRGILNDTLIKYYEQANLFSSWKYTAFDSTSEHAGISILKEMDKTVSGCFFDSEHVAKTLLKEVEVATDLMHKGGFVAIDDGNYNYKYQNTAYINMIRAKHDLPAIDNPSDNIVKPFYDQVEKILKKKFKGVEKIDDTYKKNFKDDIFWTYYEVDREVMANLSMEKTENLIHRFDAWRVKGKI